jgi:hypothetical protein
MVKPMQTVQVHAMPLQCIVALYVTIHYELFCLYVAHFCPSMTFVNKTGRTILRHGTKKGRNDTQHNETPYNDTQHNNTQHNNTQHNNTQYNDISIMTLGKMTLNTFMLSVIYAECRKYAYYAECRYAECHHTECRGALKGYPICLALTLFTTISLCTS